MTFSDLLLVRTYRRFCPVRTFCRPGSDLAGFFACGTQARVSVVGASGIDGCTREGCETRFLLMLRSFKAKKGPTQRPAEENGRRMKDMVHNLPQTGVEILQTPVVLDGAKVTVQWRGALVSVGGSWQLNNSHRLVAPMRGDVFWTP